MAKRLLEDSATGDFSVREGETAAELEALAQVYLGRSDRDRPFSAPDLAPRRCRSAASDRGPQTGVGSAVVTPVEGVTEAMTEATGHRTLAGTATLRAEELSVPPDRAVR